MEYEVKSISPGAVFINALRVFVIVGLIVGFISFFILPNPNIHLPVWWQKILATGLFTVVYALVVSVVLALIAWLYNFWAGSYRGLVIHLEKSEE